MSDPPPRVPRREHLGVYPSNLKPLDSSMYENNDSLRRVRHSKDNVPREAISLGAIIGETKCSVTAKFDQIIFL